MSKQGGAEGDDGDACTASGSHALLQHEDRDQRREHDRGLAQGRQPRRVAEPIGPQGETVRHDGHRAGEQPRAPFRAGGQHEPRAAPHREGHADAAAEHQENPGDVALRGRRGAHALRIDDRVQWRSSRPWPSPTRSPNGSRCVPSPMSRTPLETSPMPHAIQTLIGSSKNATAPAAASAGAAPRAIGYATLMSAVSNDLIRQTR